MQARYWQVFVPILTKDKIIFMIWVTHMSIVAVLHNIHNKWRWEKTLCHIATVRKPQNSPESCSSTGPTLALHYWTWRMSPAGTWLGSTHTAACCCCCWCCWWWGWWGWCWATAAPGCPTPPPPMTQEPTYWPWVEEFTELVTDRDQTGAEQSISKYWSVSVKTIKLNILRSLTLRRSVLIGLLKVSPMCLFFGSFGLLKQRTRNWNAFNPTKFASPWGSVSSETLDKESHRDDESNAHK